MWVGENRGGCAIESQERSKKERKRKKKKREKSQKRDFRFLPTIREIRPIKRGGIPLPRLASLYWILRINKPRLRHEHADPNTTRLQRVFQHKTENIFENSSVLSKGTKMCRYCKVFVSFQIECFFQRIGL